MNQKIQELQNAVNQCSNIVFFGGAGVSTESGIPDFRSTDGLYHQKYDYPPETILSHSFFLKHTKEFYHFYKDKMICLTAKPNKAHLALADWEAKGKLRAVITQNIDGLHQMAGSKEVLELHGSVLRNYCIQCGAFADVNSILSAQEIPHCTCGGILKPDVVLYEEPLQDKTMSQSIRYIQEAEMLIVGGTSLTVYPAAGLIRYFRGKYLVLINRDATSYDEMADIVLHESIGNVLSQIEVNP